MKQLDITPIPGEPDLNPQSLTPQWTGNERAGKPEKRAHSRSFNKCCIVHTTENGIEGSAMSVMRWQNRQEERYSGYHFEVDRHGWWCFMNPLTTRAWHGGKSEIWGGGGTAGASNHIGMALVAQAADWRHYKQSDVDAVIDHAARCAAYISLTYSIPLRRISREDYLAGVQGFLGHEDVAIPSGRKVDPGRRTGFPWQQMLAKAKAYAKAHTDKQKAIKKREDAERQKEVDKMREEQKRISATLPPKQEDANAEFINEAVQQLRDADATVNSLEYTLRFYRRLAAKAGISGSKPEDVADWLLKGTHLH